MVQEGAVGAPRPMDPAILSPERVASAGEEDEVG
jgi:hypothetical protein